MGSSMRSLLQESDSYRIGLSTCLHKDVAGSLVACASLGELVRLDLEKQKGHAQAEKLLAQLDSTLRAALQVVRELTEAQFPPVLKAFGLNVALQQHLREMAEHFSGSVILHTEGEEPAFDMASRLNLFRIIQSLITQCVKHARPSWIEVTCRAQKTAVEIAISHDGSDDMWASEEAVVELSIVNARCQISSVQMNVAETGPRGGSRISLIAFIQANDGTRSPLKP